MEITNLDDIKADWKELCWSLEVCQWLHAFLLEIVTNIHTYHDQKGNKDQKIQIDTLSKRIAKYQIDPWDIITNYVPERPVPTAL